VVQIHPLYDDPYLSVHDLQAYVRSDPPSSLLGGRERIPRFNKDGSPEGDVHAAIRGLLHATTRDRDFETRAKCSYIDPAFDTILNHLLQPVRADYIQHLNHTTVTTIRCGYTGLPLMELKGGERDFNTQSLMPILIKPSFDHIYGMSVDPALDQCTSPV
jgi:hypothetical protein